eukprot:359605_1
MTSWYVENGCISIGEVPPFWLVLLFVYVQVVWTIIMLLPSTTPTNEILNAAASISTIGSMAIVAGFHIVKSIEWTGNHRDDSGWDHFMCMGAIIFTSANTKTVITAILTASAYDHDWDWERLGILQKVVVWMISIWGILMLSFYIVIFIPSLFVIGWPLILISCCVFMFKSNGYCGGFDGGDLNDCAILCMRTFMFSMIVLSITVNFFIPLGMINIYAGMNYKYAFFEPFLERHWSLYWHYIENTYFVATVRFVLWLC